MSKTLFIVLNILLALFFFCGIPILPNPALFGWLPLQLAGYIFCGFSDSVLWGIYYSDYLKKQTRYE